MCKYIEGNVCILERFCHCHPKPDNDNEEKQIPFTQDKEEVE